MSSFKNTEQEGKTGPVWGMVPVGGEDIRKRCRRVNVVEILCTPNENGRMRPVKTIPGMGGGGIKENDGWGEFNYGML
jgi:hypothetical protein